MKTLLSVATVVIVAAALVTAWLNFNSTRAARASQAAIEAERAKLTAEVESAQQRAAAAKRDEAELQTVLSEVRSRAATPPAPAKKAARAVPPPNNADILKLMDANPELRTLFRESQRANISARFRPLYAGGKFTPDQIRKFEDLMVEDAEEKLDFAAVLQKQGIAPNDSAAQKMRKESEAALIAAQKSALGEVGYQDLEEFMRTQPVAGIVTEVGTLVFSRSGPLTEPQALRLREVLANASPAYQAGGRADPNTIDWPKVMTDAQTFLSPPQLEALRAQGQMPAVFDLIKQFYQQQNAAAGK